MSYYTGEDFLSGWLVDADGSEVAWNTLDDDVQQALEDKKIYYLLEEFDSID